MNNPQLPENSDLSQKITDTLNTAFDETLPESLTSFLKQGELRLFNLPEGFNLDLLGEDSNTPITPFFSGDVDPNFPNIFAQYVDTITSASDPNIVALKGQEVKFVWGRHGTDSLFAYDPGIDYSGQRKIDVLTGDYTDEEIVLLQAGEKGPFREWKDRFILGDWQKSNYLDDNIECNQENKLDNLGLKQFAIINDLNPHQDVIKLHGTCEDYELANTSLGTAIFKHSETGYDLIGVVARVFDLSFNNDNFIFKGDTVPETVLDDAQHIGTPQIDYLFASSIDDENNLFLGVGTEGSLAEQNNGSRDSVITKYDDDGSLQWSRQFGSPGSETVWDMASDGSNIYSAGNTTNQFDNNISEGGNDAYLAKYDSDGNQQWVKQYGTSTFEESFAVATDNNGNIYTGGHTLGSLAGPNKNLLLPNNAPSTDSFIVKFDSNGNQQWIQQFGTEYLDDNWGVATDKDGNVFAGGNTKGDFGAKNPGQLREYDAWLAKFDTHGNQQWVRQFGIPDYDFLWDVKTDSVGNVYSTGWTLGDLGGKNNGTNDACLAK